MAKVVLGNGQTITVIRSQKNNSMDSNYLNVNRALWDEKTKHHQYSDFYDMEGFLSGKTSLREIELTALAPLVAGKSVLHLQCHFGQDSLSLARMGAKVTGVDFSSTAIELARSLNTQLGLDAQFVVSDVYGLPEVLKEKFDLVFTSYGVITWLPDLTRWASVIRQMLQPDGTFYLAEFHPTLYMYDHDKKEIGYRYFDHTKPYEEVETGTYADADAPIQQREFFWSHSLAGTIQPLLDQGLQLKKFQEFDYSPYNCFPNMQEVGPSRFVYGDLEDRLPHVFSVEMGS